MLLAANELMAAPTSCCRSGITDLAEQIGRDALSARVITIVPSLAWLYVLVNGKRWSTPDQAVPTSSSANT